uniref:Rhodanese domain-containing protein n=1 Tax=Panagrolaimus sp. ES5 TaxID=591445 RepID=A0AC34G956_9BILA
DRQLAVELSNANLENEIIIPIKVEQPKPQVSEDVFDDLITPKQLVDCAKKGRRILIIDYREKTDVQINFKGHADGSNIVVALCPPQFIESNITLVHLSKVMPIRERQKVDKKEMEKYDLVVFMDDDNPKKNSKNELLPPANHLMKGLTTYAYNNRLKRPPLFLKGGFKMWSFTYAPYTNKEFNNSLFSEDDEFGRLLQEMKQSDTTNTSMPSQQYSNHTVSNGHPASSQQHSALSNGYPNAAASNYSQQQPSTVPPRPPTYQAPAASLKSVPKALPAVGTLGGARVADPTPPQLPSSKQS